MVLTRQAIEAHKATKITRIKLLEVHLVGVALRANVRGRLTLKQIDLRDLRVVVIDGDARERVCC